MEPRKLREALRREGIFLHESDPVLEIAAICEFAVADTVKAIEELNEAAAGRISVASVQHIEAAKTAAAALITDAGNWAAERLKDAAAEVSAAMLRDLRQETAKGEAAARLSVRMAWLIGGISAVALAGIAGFWLACRNGVWKLASPIAGPPALAPRGAERVSGLCQPG